MLIKILVAFFIKFANSDIYMHNPRGSNNRCDELTNDRLNANRLFDSQNNAAGGYAIGCDRPLDNLNISCYEMSYYEDTVLPITWTSQHNCGEENNCEIILQYMCKEEIRDSVPLNINGNTCTETIPLLSDDNLANPFKYSKHESLDSYLNCQKRTRNANLFTADQILRGKSSIYTRQNANGDRYGLECPEERDYYPYWGQSDWRDIAVLTSNLNRCSYYFNESRCNKVKTECLNGLNGLNSLNGLNGLNSLNNNLNKSECQKINGTWMTYDKFDNCNMTCLNINTGTINRLGIGQNSTGFNEYHWRLPKAVLNSKCTIRIRYNITSREVPWDYSFKDNSKLVRNPIKNTTVNVPVRMAINTDQYGRTFQDRSWNFKIIKRPENLKDKIIHNVNVQGKRGNIAQVRNCVEYDFIPNSLKIQNDEFLHFQWVGSDYNPLNNDGEGKRGTDRSNLVEIDSYRDNMPSFISSNFFSENTFYSLATIGQKIDNASECFTYSEYQRLLNIEENIKNCAILNAADPYFNLPPFRISIKINGSNNITMMSSRNNNFSNRAQKLKILVVAKEMATSSSSGKNPTVISPAIILVIVMALVSTVLISYVVYSRKIKPGVAITAVFRTVQRNLADKL